MSRRNSGLNIEEIKRMNTTNKNVDFILEKIDESYVFYLESYGERIDFILSSEDEGHMLKVLSFMVECYNEGLIDGRNDTIMFMNR